MTVTIMLQDRGNGKFAASMHTMPSGVELSQAEMLAAEKKSPALGAAYIIMRQLAKHTREIRLRQEEQEQTRSTFINKVVDDTLGATGTEG